MTDLLLSSLTRVMLERSLANPPHALMLTGPEGAGKLCIATNFAARVLGTSTEELERQPYFKLYQPVKNTFTIDQVRDLHRFMMLKTTGKAALRRIVILQDAHTMTVEAQNALLKLLEEPPADSIIIVTAQGDKSLKPTIYSRTQQVAVKPVSLGAATEYFTSQGHAQTAITRNHALSDGYVGLLSTLLEQDTDHPLANAITIAKELVAANTYQRLCRVDELSKDKQDLGLLLYAIKRVSSVGLYSAANKGSGAAVQRWKRILSSVYETESTIRHNPHTKLLLTDLFLQM